MANNLTEADETEHRITFREAGKADKKICAAYVTTEDKHPDMLAFKDHRNRTVLLVSRESVLAVERVEQQGGCAESAAFAAAAAGVQYWTGPGEFGVTLTAIRCPACGTQLPADCPAKVLIAAPSFEQVVADAAAQARRECPAHEVIRLGQ
jgi:hypothetical protein